MVQKEKSRARNKDLDKMEEKEKQEKTLKETIEDLRETIENSKKKKFKLPVRAKIGKRHARQNYTTVCYINDNKEVSFTREKIKEGTTMAEGVPRVATADHMLTYKGKPFLIQPSWSTEPFSVVANYEETVRDKVRSAGLKLLLNRIEMGGVVEKKKMSGKMIIGFLAVIIIIAYLLLA